jgi:hypothetical protein
VVLESLKNEKTIAELASDYGDFFRRYNEQWPEVAPDYCGPGAIAVRARGGLKWRTSR